MITCAAWRGFQRPSFCLEAGTSQCAHGAFRQPSSVDGGPGGRVPSHDHHHIALRATQRLVECTAFQQILRATQRLVECTAFQQIYSRCQLSTNTGALALCRKSSTRFGRSNLKAGSVTFNQTFWLCATVSVVLVVFTCASKAPAGQSFMPVLCLSGCVPPQVVALAPALLAIGVDGTTHEHKPSTFDEYTHINLDHVRGACPDVRSSSACGGHGRPPRGAARGVGGARGTI